MKYYLSIWKLLPRVTIGLAFAMVVVLAIGGVQGTSRLTQAARKFCMGFQSEFVALIISAFLIAAISALGYQLVRTLGSACGAIARKITPLFLKYCTPRVSMLVDLAEPIAGIVKRTYQANSDFFIKHYALKSAGDEKLDQMDKITKHFAKVREHTDAILNWDIVCAQAYQESLSQDQRKIENMEEELSSERSFLVVLLLASPVIFIRMWVFGIALAIASGVILLLIGIAGLPSHADKKRRLAQLLLASYLDVFTVSEMTEYAEREGEPKL